MSNLLTREIESKNIVWFQNSNSYLILEPIVAETISKINTNISDLEIEKWLINTIDAPLKQIKSFLLDVKSIYLENINKSTENEYILNNPEKPDTYFSTKYYSISNYIFQIQFETEDHEFRIHPVFAHLEIKEISNYHFNYSIFNKDNSIVFFRNSKFIGCWKKADSHLFVGKVSMYLLIDIYKKPEKDWLGVFHASAVSNDKEAVLFLGDSGNGKSTSLALLNANGYNCIADDFVPIDNQKRIHTYPAAISIKKNSVSTLLPFYPELEKSAEYHLKSLNKVVRYLPNKKIDYQQKLKCKALVFIKYQKESEIEINTITKIEAFQQLVPDSWISPLKENASFFLDWFLELPCYQLTYSNNKKMIEIVSKIFNDEL